MRSLTIVLTAIAIGMLLSSCATEEGSKRRMMTAQSQGKAMSSSQWQGIVYVKPGSSVQGHKLGHSKTRTECAHAAKEYIKKHNMAEGIFSCHHQEKHK